MDNAVKAAVITGSAVIVAAFCGALATNWFGASNPTPKPSTIAAPSPTATATGPSATSPLSSPTPPAVFYMEQITLPNGYYADLDNPTWALSTFVNTSGTDIDLGAYKTGYLENDNGSWGFLSNSGVLGYAACSGFTDFRVGLVPASDFPPGTRLCVKTSEGRIGLLKVVRISGPQYAPSITFDVTVWG